MLKRLGFHSFMLTLPVPVGSGLTYAFLSSLKPKVCAIGPLHTHLRSRLAATALPLASSHSPWEEEKRCIAWLNDQLVKSVIYVSIGILATTTRDQLTEIWYGLVNSGVRFLWVQRPGTIAGSIVEGDEAPEELAKATKERGYIVGWAPQEEVLGHPGIGAFLTHSNWSSTLESIVEGVLMIGWPYFVDQHVDIKYLSEVWKLGLEMKDTCDRVIVEKMVKDVMELRRDEFLPGANELAKLAKSSVSEGGSSYNDLDNLIEDVRLTKLKA